MSRRAEIAKEIRYWLTPSPSLEDKMSLRSRRRNRYGPAGPHGHRHFLACDRAQALYNYVMARKRRKVCV